MGIFSRLFRGGQDGNPPDDSSGDSSAVDEVLAGMDADDEPEITMSSPGEPAPQGFAPAGLTPAFATANASGSASAEPPRSIWDWQGPAPRRASSSSAPPATAASEPEPRAKAPLPSLPKLPPAVDAARDAAKANDSTMILSPPPAPTPAPPPTARSKTKPGAPAPKNASASGSMNKLATEIAFSSAESEAMIPALTTPSAPEPAAPAAVAAPVAPAPVAPAAVSAPVAPAAVMAPVVPAAKPLPSPPRARAPSTSPPLPSVAAPATPPSATPAAAGRPARRAHSDSVGAAFDQAMSDAPGARDGVSSEADLAEVRRVFEEVAAIHVAQVRDVMLELRYGEAQPAWIESTQPALRSLRAMAAQMDLTDLCSALDEFCVAVDAAVAGRARIDDDGKGQLMTRYERLIQLIPQAFELDAERDRREPIIVESLLYQIEGVERRTIEKLFAVGLSRLDALMKASADEIAIVAGLRAELAESIVGHLRAYREAASSSLAAADPLAERRALGDLLIMLSVQNDEYMHAASKWSSDARTRKSEARKAREQTFQRIKVALARLGEREQLARLDKMPFNERIATLDRYLSAAVPPRSTQKP